MMHEIDDDKKAVSAGAMERPIKPVDRAAWVPTIEVIRINDYLIGFYEGRHASNDPPFAENYDNWVYYGAMNLGVCAYAIHKGDRAILYDTMAVPEQARWIRDYLKTVGINRFTVVLSHWHLDHIGGNSEFEHSDIISTRKTRDLMAANKDAIEAGELWGPPPIKPLMPPNITFDDRLDMYLNDLKVECHRFNIHSPDSNLIYIPSDKILLAGDTLEDTVTYIVEPQDIPVHVAEMKRLKAMDIEAIYPNHGSPEVIAKRGYTLELIDATMGYVIHLVKRSHDPGYLDTTARDFISDYLAEGCIHYFEPYEASHEHNVKTVYDYWKDKTLPIF
jgi:glyoxylase-like metal-dependent hydrolase (beta-lactamase superfamily II)